MAKVGRPRKPAALRLGNRTKAELTGVERPEPLAAPRAAYFAPANPGPGYRAAALPPEWAGETLRVNGYDPRRDAGECTFHPALATRAVGFFADCLHHVKGRGAGTAFVLRPWQRAVIANLFGWLRPDGTRRYRTCFLYVPRKNGKSCLAAGLILYVLNCDNEAGAEIYSAAADKEQARLVFDHARGMVQSEANLFELNGCKVYKNSILREGVLSFYKIVSSDVSTKWGYSTHLGVIDELHAHKDRELVEAIDSSTGARTQPLVIYTTTADFAGPSICNEKLDYARKVRDGVLEKPDASFLPAIWEAGRDEDWHSPAVWRKANPNFGVTVLEDFFHEQHARACELPTEQNTFRRLYLNTQTEQDVRWLPMEKWDACALPLPDLRGRRCYAGLDMSTVSDLTAFVLWFPLDDGGGAVLPFAWVPEESARERERKARVPYATWCRDGWIRPTNGNTVDHDAVRRDIVEIGKLYDIQEIAIDRWNSHQIATQLAGEGFLVVPFGQGFASMSAPCKELERLLACGILRHGGNPVLRWQAGNVAAEMDAAGNVKPAKHKSSEKIDCIVALVMALGRAIVAPAAGNVYETRGIRTL